jgi:hypothetical protein
MGGQMKLTREVAFESAFDRRDPDPKKNCGIHGVEIRFILTGKKGATQFVIYTNWFLPHVQKELYAKGNISHRLKFGQPEPMGADIGYHSRTPQYKGQAKMRGGCQYLGGKPCYYDGSGLRADEFIPAFLSGGSDAVWKMLEDEYRRRFESGEKR